MRFFKVRSQAAKTQSKRRWLALGCFPPRRARQTRWTRSSSRSGKSKRANRAAPANTASGHRRGPSWQRCRSWRGSRRGGAARWPGWCRCPRQTGDEGGRETAAGDAEAEGRKKTGIACVRASPSVPRASWGSPDGSERSWQRWGAASWVSSVSVDSSRAALRMGPRHRVRQRERLKIQK